MRERPELRKATRLIIAYFALLQYKNRKTFLHIFGTCHKYIKYFKQSLLFMLAAYALVYQKSDKAYHHRYGKNSHGKPVV